MLTNCDTTTDKLSVHTSSAASKPNLCTVNASYEREAVAIMVTPIS